MTIFISLKHLILIRVGNVTVLTHKKRNPLWIQAPQYVAHVKAKILLHWPTNLRFQTGISNMCGLPFPRAWCGGPMSFQIFGLHALRMSKQKSYFSFEHFGQRPHMQGFQSYHQCLWMSRSMYCGWLEGQYFMASGHPLVPNHEMHFSFSQLTTLPFQNIFFKYLPKCKGSTMHSILKDGVPLTGRWGIKVHQGSIELCSPNLKLELRSQVASFKKYPSFKDSSSVHVNVMFTHYTHGGTGNVLTNKIRIGSR